VIAPLTPSGEAHLRRCRSTFLELFSASPVNVNGIEEREETCGGFVDFRSELHCVYYFYFFSFSSRRKKERMFKGESSNFNVFCFAKVSLLFLFLVLFIFRFCRIISRIFFYQRFFICIVSLIFMP
jgi:hypothetical protein